MLIVEQGYSHGSHGKRREQKQNHLSKATKYCKEDTYKQERRLKGVKMFNFTSHFWSMKPRSQCIGRAGEKELWSSPAGGGAKCPGRVRRDGRMGGGAARGFPSRRLQSRAPGSSSKTEWLQTIPARPVSCQTGLQFRDRIFVVSTSPFSPEDCKQFQGPGQSSSASNHSAAGQQKSPTFLQCQLSHLLLSKSSQKISIRRSNTLVYSTHV